METTVRAVALMWLLTLIAPGSATAQARLPTRSSDLWEGVSIGAAIGRSGNEDEHHQSDDRGRDLRANVEFPLGSRFAARAEFGHVSWRYDQYGSPGQSRDDVVTVNRATLSALVVTYPDMPVRGYVGVGIGVYHWRAKVGTIEEPFRRGGHFTAGLGIPVRKRQWAITGEVQVHIMTTPNRTSMPHPDGPVSGTAVLSLTHSIGFRMYL
jgi:hypothetical protein